MENFLLHLKQLLHYINFHDGKESSTIFFKEGDDLTLTMDAKEFDETIVYKGKGAVENNYLAKQALQDEKFEMILRVN